MTACYGARSTFAGMTHSGDCNDGSDLLQHIKIGQKLGSDKEYTVFVSGFQCTKLTRFKDRNPVVMIANHAEKVLQFPVYFKLMYPRVMYIIQNLGLYWIKLM